VPTNFPQHAVTKKRHRLMPFFIMELKNGIYTHRITGWFG
jgi:hypothetical protein